MTRECGPCSECCYALAVHELEKSDFTRCKHEKASKAGACGIYKTRPESCRTFRCLWLAQETGMIFDRKDRPDRIGIVFATALMQGQSVVMAYIRKPGADKAGRGKEILDQLSSWVPVCISRFDGTKSILVSEEKAHLIPMLRKELNTYGIVVDGELRRLPVVP